MRSVLLTSAVFAVLAAAAPAARADGPEITAPATTEGIVFETGTPKFEDVLAKAKAAKKPVFIDFTTDWCVWCRRLEKDTFSQASVGELMKSLVNVQIDAEKGEGPELKARYGVNGYPTLVVVDAQGDEIDRIVGYRKPEEFTAEIRRMLNGDGTLPALREAYTAAPEDAGAALAYGAKLAGTKPAEAAAIYAKLLESGAVKDHAKEAEIRLERAAALAKSKDNEGAMTEAEKLAAEFADTPSAAKAPSRLAAAIVASDARRALALLETARPLAADAGQRSQIDGLVRRIHKAGIAAALKRQAEAAGDDPQELNEVAWTCFEERVNVREALAWAKKAVELSKDDPAILDTLANLLWLTGKHAEAIEVETKAAEKCTEQMARMKKDFLVNIAKWKAEDEALRAAEPASAK
jgi:thioredoxin-like negative regulator of GroEL